MRGFHEVGKEITKKMGLQTVFAIDVIGVRCGEHLPTRKLLASKELSLE
jgi:hypothetical protein